MNYLAPDAPNLLEDITRRKEFYQYLLPETKDEKRPAYFVPKFDTDQIEEEDVNLELNSYQSAVGNLLNPNTPYARLLLKWEPGMGKTIAAINIAMRFIQLYERETEMDDPTIGSVFIIGFTEEIFKKELLSYPKYGFINREEIRQLNELREQAYLENKTDIDRLQEFQSKLRKRLTSRKDNGYFKFFGYKAFVNRIFLLQDFKKNINEMTEEQIRQSLKDGSLKWNKPLLDSFRNSIVICDEIHNVYNSLEKNNWGVALQMVLDYHPSLKAVFMSATPLNNSPTEIIDLLNLLLPVNQKVTKAQFFKDKTLVDGAIEKIATLCRGRVSFVQDSNPAYFATQSIEGETIADIPYLKFIRCPMSTFHYQTYKAVYTGALSQDAQYLVDIAFPNPIDPSPGKGLFRTAEIRKALSYASEEWFRKYGFKYENDTITGPGFFEENIGQWSSKMAQLLKLVKSMLKPQEGKIFIYHNVVHVSGVIFIEQLLQHNGFISIDQNDTQNTLCAQCGAQKKDHFDEEAEKERKSPKARSPKQKHHKHHKHHKKAKGGAAEIDFVDFKDQYRDALTAMTKEAYQYDEKHSVDLDGKIVVAIQNDKPVGYIEYEPGNQSTHIVNAIVAPEHRKKGILRALLSAVPADMEQTVCIYKKWEHGPNNKTIWEHLGFIVHNDDEDTWYASREPLADIEELEEAKAAVEDDKEDKEDTKSPYIEDVKEVIGGKVLITDHRFSPVRYIVAHSDMDKTIMNKNIEKFNSNDNTFGYTYKIIVGSKIIKESYNLKAIQKGICVGRPDNIPTLIQIMGRARRKYSHVLLPAHLRHIKWYILTSCIPEKDARGAYLLSHEEVKYREKIEDYKIIQRIERTFHENAIDAIITRNIIEPGLTRKNTNLGALWYEPKIQAKVFKLRDLNLTTFSIFHASQEIKTIIYIIKRLFISTSLVWTFDDLWAAVQSPGFHVEINSELFQMEYFIIALSILLFKSNDSYVQPMTQQSEENVHILDLMHNDIDKRIMMPDKTIGYIHYIGEYYMFIPFRDGTHHINIESPFRTYFMHKNKAINVHRYLKESSGLLNYENMKLKFKARYQNVPIEKLATVVGRFGTAFHSQFIEEVIKYVFNLWTNPIMTEKSEYHEFYFKMLYYYDLVGLVIWAYAAKDFIAEMYKSYLMPYSVTQTDEVSNLISSISKSKKEESMKLTKTEYFNTLKLSLQTLSDRKSSTKKVRLVKADPRLLPVGHFMGHVPKFYHPEKEWFESPEYVQRSHEYKENDVAIGYYEKSSTGLRIKFKIRSPIQQIQKFKDIRMIEKGSICSSNSKQYLMDLAKKLKLKIPEKINVPNLCSEIESQLLVNELKERRSKSNVKWFYSFWENRPDERRVAASVSQS